MGQEVEAGVTVPGLRRRLEGGPVFPGVRTSGAYLPKFQVWTSGLGREVLKDKCLLLDLSQMLYH